MKKKLFSSLVGVALLSFASIFGVVDRAIAMPMTYQTSFDGSGSGPAGTGSFIWDVSTNTMTSFVWDFGAGNTGGIIDSALAALLSPPISGIDDFGHLLFEVITDPSQSGLGPGVGFGSASMIGPYGALVSFRTTTPTASYTMWSDVGLISSGLVSARSVPEPAALALFGIGLAGMGFARKKRKSA